MNNLLKQIQSDATPLIIATILVTFSGLAYLFFHVTFNINYIFGLIAVCITWYTYFSDKQIYRYTFTIILILVLLKYLSF